MQGLCSCPYSSADKGTKNNLLLPVRVRKLGWLMLVLELSIPSIVYFHRELFTKSRLRKFERQSRCKVPLNFGFVGQKKNH